LSFWVSWDTYKEIAKRGAEVYLPIFGASGYKHGFISGQVKPQIRHDVDPMVVQAEEVHSLLPNVMIKVPGTVCP
jgi:transaldolase